MCACSELASPATPKRKQKHEIIQTGNGKLYDDMNTEDDSIKYEGSPDNVEAEEMETIKHQEIHNHIVQMWTVCTLSDIH